jgi:sorting nexin-9/18/33
MAQFTADFASSPSHKPREASNSSITPRGSPKPDPQPIMPQHTGEWFPSFRRNLMGGKSLNRFSSFVTSGAEEWVLKGAPEDKPPPPIHHRLTSEPDEVFETTLSKLGVAEEDMHYVDEGPSWKIKLPPFRILVHSPAKRTSPLTGSYTVYSVTSLFRPPDSGEDIKTESHRVTVHRRFSHFLALHTALSRRLPGIALPPLPEKQYAGRFSDAFIEARRGDLERLR